MPTFYLPSYLLLARRLIATFVHTTLFTVILVHSCSVIPLHVLMLPSQLVLSFPFGLVLFTFNLQNCFGGSKTSSLGFHKAIFHSIWIKKYTLANCNTDMVLSKPLPPYTMPPNRHSVTLDPVENNFQPRSLPLTISYVCIAS